MADYITENKNGQTFTPVLSSYIAFLQFICSNIVNKREIDRNRRKFEAVKKELYNFLVRHKRFFIVDFCYYKFNKKPNRIICPLKFNYSGNCDQFLNFENFLRHFKANKKVVENVPYDIIFNLSQDTSRQKSRICKVLEKYPVTNEVSKMFFKTHFLVPKEVLNTKLSNYDELARHIDGRIDGYQASVVSAERIEEMSFAFEGSVEGLKGEPCPICMDEYEKGRQVCRFPCGHFCCRKCTEGTFKFPETNGARCPLCNDDCS